MSLIKKAKTLFNIYREASRRVDARQKNNNLIIDPITAKKYDQLAEQIDLLGRPQNPCEEDTVLISKDSQIPHDYLVTIYHASKKHDVDVFEPDKVIDISQLPYVHLNNQTVNDLVNDYLGH